MTDLLPIFEWFRGADNLYYAFLRTSRHRVIAIGKGWRSRSDCMSAISAVMQADQKTPTVFVKEESTWPRKRKRSK